RRCRADAQLRGSGRVNTRGVERACEAPVGSREARVAREIHAAVDSDAVGSGDVGCGDEAVIDRRRSAADEGSLAADLPAVENDARNRRIPEGAESRKLIDEIQCQVLAAVEQGGAIIP